MIFIILFYGYSSFRPWSVQNFFIYYTMLILGMHSFRRMLFSLHH
jgi:amino acid transporter